MTYPRKFALIAILFGLPLVMVTLLLVLELNDRIAFSAKERLGVEYLRAVQNLTTTVRNHRGLTWAHANQQLLEEPRHEIEERLPRDAQKIDAVDRRLGHALRTTFLWGKIKHKCASLLDNDALGVLPPTDPANRHTALIADLLALTSLVGDQSNLILDPELDSYYLMESTVNQLPQLTEQIGQLRGFGAGLCDLESVSPAERLHLQNLASAIKSQREIVERHFRIAFRETHDPTLQDSLQPKLQTVLASTDQFLKLINNFTERPPTDEVWQRGSDALANYNDLYSQASVALDRLLETRITALQHRRLLVLVATILCSLLVAYLLVAFYQQVKRAIAQLDEASQKFVRGLTHEVNFDVDTHDELGQVTRSLAALATRLNVECVSLQNKKQEMRAVLDGAIDAIFTMNERGEIESANPATERLFDYPVQQFAGKCVNVLLRDAFRSSLDGIIWYANENGEKRVTGDRREVVGTRRDGTTFQAELSVGEVKLHDRRMFTCFVRDVTERRNTERALESAHLQMAGLLDAATQISIIATDSNGLITVFNSGAQRLLGYTADEMIGKHTPERIHLREEVMVHSHELSRELGRPVVGMDVFFAYTENNRVGRREWTYVRKDGSHVMVSLVITAVVNAEGKITGYLGVAEDITLRKQTERNLVASRENAERAARAKSDFLANMSHEIRTPMTAIMGYADLLLNDHSVDRNQELKTQAIQTIKRNGEYLLGIINDILDISKIESGKMTMESLVCSPQEIIHDVTSLMQVRSQEKKIGLEVILETPLPGQIQTDPTRLRQILVNLIGNAIKFTACGKVTLIARFVNLKKPTLEFDIVDTGIGMTSEQQKQLFKPFTQADETTTRNFGGTGLGLTISKRFAEMLNGTVSVVESVPGQGTRFRASIGIGMLNDVATIDQAAQQVVEPQSNPTPQAGVAVSGNLADCRILLAEDGPDNQRLISYVLQKAGADVTVVENGQLAVEHALRASTDEHPFHVILMDMQMPVLDGYRAATLLRSQNYTGPIIALTAHAMSSDRDQCLVAGCDDYATKPIDRMTLVATCQRWREQALTSMKA